MKTITAVIIDDEPKATKLLKLLIEEVDPKIKVTETYNDPSLALERLKSRDDLQLIFLDIDMPGISGFDFLIALDKPDISVIFVTGHDQYAIDAFKIAAAGYILKPIDTEELREVIAKVKALIRLQKNRSVNLTLLENMAQNNISLKKIGIPSNDGIDFIQLQDIISLEGTDKYTNINISGRRSILSSYNIGEFRKILDASMFFQSHRSHIINVDRIHQYQKDGTIIMEDGSKAPLARRRKEEFLKWMILPSK